MSDARPDLANLLELANLYPSPHNGQPIRLGVISEGSFKLQFDTDRGLSAAPISHLFSFVTIGVFVRHLELCAQALGYKARVELALPREQEMAGPGLLDCGTVTLTGPSSKPDPELEQLIRARQTSRKAYDHGLPSGQQNELISTARRHRLNLQFVTPAQARQVAWLNQRAVFDDMFDRRVRTELAHWLRYSKVEKEARRDGLSYDCMELNGHALEFSVRHYRVLRWPVVAPLLKQYYLRTMADSSTVGYLLSPFEAPAEAYAIGYCLIDLWFDLTRHGAYLHPFGTLVSNRVGHRDFDRVIGLTDETRANYVVFIFRAGYSGAPARSLRLPVADHLGAGVAAP